MVINFSADAEICNLTSALLCIDNPNRYAQSRSTLRLNLSRRRAAITPTARQMILVMHCPADAVKLENGMIIMVAAITMPTMP